MNIDIRQAVLSNLNNSTYDTIEATILDAVSTREDKTLPGLGVLFEVLWNSASSQEKTTIINNIHKVIGG